MSERRRTVWITRAEPGASATAERVRARGLAPVVAPLLAVRPIGGARIDLAGAVAIAFTSANAVRAFAARSPERGLPTFAVGDATAAAARAAGYSRVTSADGDLAALAGLLAARKHELDGVVIYPSAAEPSGDLAAALAPVGLCVRQTPVYETVAVAPPRSLIARLPDVDAVLIHSARAAEALAAVLGDHPAPRLAAYGISDQALRPLETTPLARRIAATAPDEAALLALLNAP